MLHMTISDDRIQSLGWIHSRCENSVKPNEREIDQPTVPKGNNSVICPTDSPDIQESSKQNHVY